MSDDDWREERLRARRQREAEEAAAEEAAAAARAAPPPPPPVEAPPRPRPLRVRPPSPGFGRTQTQAGPGLSAFGLTLPPLNVLQISLIVLGVVLAISLLTGMLRSHHPAGDASPSGAAQQAAVVQPDGADEAGSAPSPAQLRPSLPVSAAAIATVGPDSGASAAPAAGDQPVVTTPARWTEKPTDAEIAAAFPDAARSTDTSGRAVIQCVISAAGEPGSCTVQSESPQGDGFGQAALSLAQKFKFKAKTVNGVAVDGGVATVSVRFSR